jgi:23S rRNA pseudouridine1911/1915/1917 synthase
MIDFSINLLSKISGERIDVFLIQQFPDLSRSKIQKYIKDGFIKINGEKVKASWILSEEDHIIGEIKKEVETRNEPEDIPLDVLFEDEYYIVINKKAGIIIHPGNGVKNGTLVNALLFHFNQLSEMNTMRPGIVHRLDKDTTGVIIVAKTDNAHSKMAKLFENREVKKIYKAITWGKVSEKGTIDSNICRNPMDRTLFTTSLTKGRDALTIYKLNNFYSPLSYVSVGLKTGRTHQIRVHMKSIGHSIICDSDYSGGKKRIKSFHSKYNQILTRIFNKINRVALHAELLEFIHPVTGQNMKFVAPLPDDMKSVLSILKEYGEA